MPQTPSTFEQRPEDSAARSVWLVSAYAVSPRAGSEPGVGFAWFAELGRRYHVVLFTEAEFREQLIEWIRMNPKVSCSVHFIDLGEAARSRCWNQGDWRFYADYWRFHLAVFRRARAEIRANRPSVLHQLNMIGFRSPGYLWLLGCLMRVPFVWGPIGGYNFPDPRMYGRYGVSSVLRQAFKNFLNGASMLLPGVLGSWLTADVRLLAIPPRGGLLARILRAGIPFPETFVREVEGSTRPPASGTPSSATVAAPSSCPVRVAMVGKLVPRKLVDVAIDAMASLDGNERSRICLEIIGDGPVRGLLAGMALEAGIDRSVRFHGRRSHEETLAIVSSCDLLLHCSIDEGTSHAVMEALALGKPVLAFDGGGHSLVMRDCGLVPLRWPVGRDDAVSTVADGLRAAASPADGEALPRVDRNRLARWTAEARVTFLERLTGVEPTRT